MSVLRTLPTSRRVRPALFEEPVPGMSLDGVGAATMLAMALAPTAFVLAAALQMLGIHTL
jgi:hypothetical protein